MNNVTLKTCFILLFLISGTVTHAQKGKKLVLESAKQFEVVLSDDKYITYVVGDVIFKTETGYIYCDSARWLKGENAQLNGNVIIDDAAYRLTGDSIFYDIHSGEALALGKRVELWSYDDSIFAIGQHAFFDELEDYFLMEERPVMYINYPDTAQMIEVIANEIEYNAAAKDAQAVGNVIISSNEFSSYSDCAMMNIDGDVLDLFESPSVKKEESIISGELISIYFDNDVIDKIDVIDSARGEFKEPVDSTKKFYDESILSGNRITMFFKKGLMDNIVCYGQAYSWYYPSPKGGTETHENTVSGDTIRFFVNKEQLKKVHVTGGAIGRYLSSTKKVVDSVAVNEIDTIDYNSHFIEYDITDSLITLIRNAHVTSGSVSLKAFEILFDTRENIIEAFSADLSNDSSDNPYSLSKEIQPSKMPVILMDKNEEIFGDYLLYSTETEKGRIIQSKSDYSAGYYYGKKLFREQENIFYVNEGRYTTCEADAPHYHFHSSNMKMIEGDKLIAKPVVFYVERIPIFALPYYVFPLKRGRHSGFLPFTFGKFERGERYIQNVGYYWAASEYFDWQGSLDYYEIRRTLTFNSRINFRKRYVFDGYIRGNYTRETNYSSTVASETKRTRWTLRGAHNHYISPSFLIKAYGDFQSDKSYYADFSQNLDERINRNTKSQISFNKKFGKKISLSGNITHNVDLDRESRTDNIPNMSLSLPTIWPFGSGSRNEKGRLIQKWYQKFTFRYSPSLQNYSNRITIDSIFTVSVDTSITFDSTLMEYDTTITTFKDTLSYRSRKKYSKINHNPAINLPSVRLGNYMNIIPRFSYSETWFKIYHTDQSDVAGINTSTTYRTYSYQGGVSANTKLYGTIYPNIYGLVGLRHVITPSVGYSFSPEINLHPEIRAYAGGGAGSSKSSMLTFSVNQLFQAKIKKKEAERNLQLLSVTSSFSYNIENKDRPYSDLNTSFQSSALPVISSLSGRMVHSFYETGTNDIHFWSPFLLSFNINANLHLAGRNFFFDDPKEIPRGVDSASQLDPVAPTSGSKGWSLSATYSYIESGRGTSWRKSSFLNFNLRFNLTPTTTITYSQRYSIDRKFTIRNSVNIIRKIHCWTGSIYWVPVGSNRGFGFKLFVTALPEVKIDNNHDSFTQSLRR